MMNFFYCHWIAKNERDVYKQLEEANLEGKIVNSMVHEVHEFMSAYRNSNEIFGELSRRWNVLVMASSAF